MENKESSDEKLISFVLDAIDKENIDGTHKHKKLTDEELLLLLKDEEKARQKRLHIGISLTILFLILPISVICFFGNIINLFPGDNIYKIIIWASFISLGFACGTLPYMNYKFKKYLKNRYMEEVTQYFEGLIWDKYSLPLDLIRSSKLFSAFNSYTTDDMFKGKYHDVYYGIIEAQLLDIHGSSERKFIRHVFKGVIIEFDSNKNTLSSTIVTSKRDSDIRNLPLGNLEYILSIALPCLPLFVMYLMNKSLVNDFWKDSPFYAFVVFVGLPIFIVISLIALIIKFHKEDKSLKKIKLEDVNWDKRFNVYSDNQVEARYLLTTGFMERFYDLQTTFGTKKIKCSFVNDKLVIAISTNKDLFEIGSLFSSLNNLKQIYKFRDELKSILLLIEYLKLDQKTGL